MQTLHGALDELEAEGIRAGYLDRPGESGRSS